MLRFLEGVRVCLWDLLKYWLMRMGHRLSQQQVVCSICLVAGCLFMLCVSVGTFEVLAEVDGKFAVVTSRSSFAIHLSYHLGP
jgi:hypothetical protein